MGIFQRLKNGPFTGNDMPKVKEILLTAIKFTNFSNKFIGRTKQDTYI